MNALSINKSQTLPVQAWLLPIHAADYLGVTLSSLIPLVETGQLQLHRGPDQGLRFNISELDSVLLPVPTSEAGRLLTAEALSHQKEIMHTSQSTSSKVPTPNTNVPLKEAALQLEIPYKTLLRLVHAGKILATNLGSPRRPRFMVDPEAMKRQWAELAQREMRQRSAPAASVDFSRLLSQSHKKTKVVPHA